MQTRFSIHVGIPGLLSCFSDRPEHPYRSVRGSRPSSKPCSSPTAEERLPGRDHQASWWPTICRARLRARAVYSKSVRPFSETTIICIGNIRKNQHPVERRFLKTTWSALGSRQSNGARGPAQRSTREGCTASSQRRRLQPRGIAGQEGGSSLKSSPHWLRPLLGLFRKMMSATRQLLTPGQAYWVSVAGGQNASRSLHQVRS